MIFFFFFNDTATTEIYTLSLHDALPISKLGWLDVARLRIWARPLLPGRGSDDGERLERFGAEQEDAYHTLRDRLPSHFVRDPAYLNWRYADSPRAYTLLASPSGYAVVGRKQFRGIDTAYVADLVAPTFRETRRLLRQ